MPTMVNGLGLTTIGNVEYFGGTIEEDIDQWVERFSRLAEINHWDDNVALVQLENCLIGGAREFFKGIDSNLKTGAGWSAVH